MSDAPYARTPRAFSSSSSSDSRTSCNPCFPADDGRRAAGAAKKRGVPEEEARAEAGVLISRGLSAMARLCASANAASASASARALASAAGYTRGMGE